jgi:hypothetical protein
MKPLGVCTRSEKRQKEEAMRNWGRDVSVERGVYCVYVCMCASRYLLLRPGNSSFPFTWNGEIGIGTSRRIS